MNDLNNSKGTPTKQTSSKNKTNNSDLSNVGIPASGILKPSACNVAFEDDRPRRDGPGGE